ncbi:hypothetical protein ACHAPU_000867 [Fusarium lateritium]
MVHQIPFHKYRPIVISGPSGAYKGSLVKMLRDTHPLTFVITVSHTTRPRRPHEDERSYHFTPPKDFQRLYRKGAFVEITEIAGHYYGTSLQAIQEALDKDLVPLLDIDMKGAKAMKKLKRLDARYVLISPLSLFDVKPRLESRGTETKASVEQRVAHGKQRPIVYTQML